MKVILWDFDRTLAHRDGGWAAAVVEALHALRPEAVVRPEDVRPHLQTGFPWQSPEMPHTHIDSADAWWSSLERTVFVRVRDGLGLRGLSARSLTGRVRQVYCSSTGWRVFPDSLPALKRMRDLGWSNRLLSNHVPELPELVVRLGMGWMFDSIHNSAVTGYEKPNPMAFRCALEMLPEKAEVWMVGDDLQADVRGAEKAGIRAVLVRSRSREARWSVDGLDDLPGILE